MSKVEFKDTEKGFAFYIDGVYHNLKLYADGRLGIYRSGMSDTPTTVISDVVKWMEDGGQYFQVG